jgi:hypothetical protein
MNWHHRQEEWDQGIVRWRPMAGNDRAMSFGGVIDAWRESAPFRETWVSWLSGVPYEAVCWECPPVSDTTLDRPFECVFVSSPSLARLATDSYAFSGHFRPNSEVATFWNLGGDALLVAPCPAETGNFAHLASFTATASAERQDTLWKAVGEALAKRIGPQPVWLNTAGHGVAWLHVRLDSQPKYYRHSPYARA